MLQVKRLACPLANPALREYVFSGTHFAMWKSIGNPYFNFLKSSLNWSINRKLMHVSVHRLPLMLLAFGLFMGTSMLSAQDKASIKVTGPCAKCTDHLLATAKGLPGVTTATFDAATSQLNLGMASGTSVLDISLELSLAGYNAGDFKADPKAKFPPCCASATRGDEEDMGDLVDDEELGDWENAENLDELDNLSTHSASGITDADFEEQNDDDSDLESVDDLGMNDEVEEEEETDADDL